MGDHYDAAMFARVGMKAMAIARSEAEAEIAAERMPQGCVKLEAMG